MSFALPEVLIRLRPSAKWKITDINDYDTIEWLDEPDTQPTQEECEEMIKMLTIEKTMETFRKERNKRLDDTDKYIVSDYPHPSPEAKQAWLDYRQALRDLPSNTTDPSNPVWPRRPDEPVKVMSETSNVMETSN